MNKLPPAARELLKATDAVHVPSERARENMRNALLRTLGAEAFSDPRQVEALAGERRPNEGDPGLSSGAETTASQAPSLSAGADTQANVGAGMPADLSTNAAVAGAKAGAGLASKIASSTLLTWRVGKLVLVSVAAGGTALMISVSAPRISPARPASPAAAAQTIAHPPGPEVPRVEASAQGLPQAAPTRAGAPLSRDERAAARKWNARATAHARAVEPSAGAPKSLQMAEAADRANDAAEKATAPNANAERTDSASAPALARSEQPPGPTDAREIALLRSALVSLRDHAPAAALKELEEHARRYPDSVLADERSGLHIIALCDLGRISDAVRRQPVFFARAGSSPLAERVRRACARSDP